MVSESWFSGLSWILWNNAPEPDKPVIGILAFEVASLMSKVVNLWHCLSDGEIVRLREDTVNSIGVRKLVSENHDYLMDLALNEIFENVGVVARSVARLGKRCTDPVYHRFEQFVNGQIRNGFQWGGCDYRLKKMERKVKKMERFAAVTTQLSQEIQVLAELEQTLRRMQGKPDLRPTKLIEFQQKVICQRQEVKNLREMSPWIRTFDYIVRLLARSLFTILERIKHVFGNTYKGCVERNDYCENNNSVFLPRSHSISAFMQSSAHPSENNLYGLHPGPPKRSVLNSGFIDDQSRTNHRRQQAHLQPSVLHGKHPRLKKAHVGPFNGCMTGGSNSPILQSCKPTGGGGSMRLSSVYGENIDKVANTNLGSPCSSGIFSNLNLFNAKFRLLKAPPSTLGDAALAIHYANVIISIEKLASSPHLIDLDTRDDLYNMLPATIRTALRARLKSSAKTSGSSVYGAARVAEWSLALVRILEWLAPLAHNMIKWQSDRNFENQQVVSKTDVLLVHTLYFANQAKTEAAITELLLGLNYICRIQSELDEKALPESAGSRAYNYHFLQRDSNIVYNVW